LLINVLSLAEKENELERGWKKTVVFKRWFELGLKKKQPFFLK